jgi:hypothetical protein
VRGLSWFGRGCGDCAAEVSRVWGAWGEEP